MLVGVVVLGMLGVLSWLVSLLVLLMVAVEVWVLGVLEGIGITFGSSTIA